MEKVDLEKLRDFVLSRKNEDGGFAFCKPLRSTLPETFYAIYVLKTIGEEVPDKDRVVDFLRRSVRDDVYAIYWTFKSLDALDEELPDKSDFLLERLNVAIKRKSRELRPGGVTATYSFEAPNVLREVFMLSEVLKLLNVDLPEFVEDFVEKFRRNGGFGLKRPNLEETFYCLSVLERGDEENLKFVLRHESEAGFVKTPGAYPPYIEDTFFALSCLKILGYEYENDEIVEFVASLQNDNGGFRRSIYGGISTLENSYYAVAILKLLGEL